MRLKKIHPTIKEQFCEQLYEEYIVKASEKLLKYEEYAETIHAKMPASCYTNFRDALFHFRRVVLSVEEKEIGRHAFAVEEHLSRSLTDAGNSLLIHLSRVAEELLKDDDFTADLKKSIRESLHEIKKTNIRKRFSGMMISDDNLSRVSHEEMQSLIDCFYDLLNRECPDKFAEYSIMLCKGYEEKVKEEA